MQAPTDTSPLYNLLVFEPATGTKDFPLAVGKYEIGRAENSDIQLFDDHVSRRHALITVEPDGAVTILDQGSSNGTFVNSRRVTSTSLSIGDRISLSSTVAMQLEAAC